MLRVSKYTTEIPSVVYLGYLSRIVRYPLSECTLEGGGRKGEF